MRTVRLIRVMLSSATMLFPDGYCALTRDGSLNGYNIHEARACSRPCVHVFTDRGVGAPIHRATIIFSNNPGCYVPDECTLEKSNGSTSASVSALQSGCAFLRRALCTEKGYTGVQFDLDAK